MSIHQLQSAMSTNIVDIQLSNCYFCKVNKLADD